MYTDELIRTSGKAFGYKGTPEKLPAYTNDRGHEHPAIPDAGWAHSPENDELTALLREREKKASLDGAVYSEPMKPI